MHDTQSSIFRSAFTEMSVSKLESLPNEILADIIEKYINGIDVLLNRRFDALIIRLQGLRFNFLRCRKDEFNMCMGLLPAYTDQIEELAIGNEDAPGQIHVFLSFFPSFTSFTSFKRLRTLYFHINCKAMDSSVIEHCDDVITQHEYSIFGSVRSTLWTSTFTFFISK